MPAEQQRQMARAGATAHAWKTGTVVQTSVPPAGIAQTAARIVQAKNVEMTAVVGNAGYALRVKCAPAESVSEQRHWAPVARVSVMGRAAMVLAGAMSSASRMQIVARTCAMNAVSATAMSANLTVVVKSAAITAAESLAVFVRGVSPARMEHVRKKTMPALRTAVTRSVETMDVVAHAAPARSAKSAIRIPTSGHVLLHKEAIQKAVKQRAEQEVHALRTAPGSPVGMMVAVDFVGCVRRRFLAHRRGLVFRRIPIRQRAKFQREIWKLSIPTR